MSADWIAISNELAEATAKIAAHTVAVHTDSRGSSSGIIWRPGIIVTSEHALRRDEEIQVTLPDGKTAAVKLVGRDASTDIAVLKCDEAKTGPTRIPRINRTIAFVASFQDAIHPTPLRTWSCEMKERL